jgi:hypothetical protein
MSDDQRRTAPGERALAVRAGLSRAELDQLRQGEIEADIVAALIDRSAGLAAPAPPAEGDLLPNGTGWRVGQGGRAERMHPRLWLLSVRAGALGGLGPTWASLLGIHHSFVIAMGLGLMPIGLLFGAVHLSAAIRLRPLRRAPRHFSVADCPSGTTVRIDGVVVSDATVPTLFAGAPAVLFTSVFGAGQQTQGIDFHLDLDGGERVRVAVRGAMLLDRPRRSRESPACGPVRVDWSTDHGRPRLTSDIFAGPSLRSRLFAWRRRYEAVIAPGDRVEVCGVLHHEPDPDARAPFARQMPTRAVIREGNKLPLLVRRLG